MWKGEVLCKVKLRDRNKDSAGEVKLKLNCGTLVEAGAHEVELKKLQLAPGLSRKGQT